MLGEGPEIGAAMLPLSLRRTAAARPATLPAVAVEPFWLQERRIIEHALAAFDGNISRAAAALQINPSTIYRKRQSWDEAERLSA